MTVGFDLYVYSCTWYLDDFTAALLVYVLETFPLTIIRSLIGWAMYPRVMISAGLPTRSSRDSSPSTNPIAVKPALLYIYSVWLPVDALIIELAQTLTL